MGRSAKFNRVGKTKKERDAIKITMNSRISKKPASGPSAARKSATASTTAVPTAANKLPARKGGVSETGGSSRKTDTAMEGVATAADKAAIEAAPAKKHILSGRVDYVSLMNSRRSAKALKELKEMKP
ncbi:hypothetical protein HDU87_005966 [Geranomyces variabilis]|uniref:Uncharacterized protein n=1 Tax=Geranomyces variabilis TaxID=109894 RepID=A0AAD5XQM1_9FUNG|nr:hypothetical protein HDU87_005966 [Geranomyces variabilis]